MKLLFRKFIPVLTLMVLSGLLWSCQQPTATVSDLSKPLSASPTPKPTPPPTIDPRRTDLNRVVVGTYAPDFSLEDMNRKIVHLSDFAASNMSFWCFIAAGSEGTVKLNSGS